ncbi:MAG: hypothetical protein ACT4O9_16360 [Blastocatellia bacterium]
MINSSEKTEDGIVIVQIDERDALEPSDSRSIEPVESQYRQSNQSLSVRYLFLPVIFLTVSLLGGIRFSGVDGSFIFLKPALICLIFAVFICVLFIRAGLIHIEGWFGDDLAVMNNAANAAILLTLFAATVQIFNSVIPEQGLPFWIVSFCFLWTLWNNLFADFDTKKLLRSLCGLFGLAFVAKYLLLANLTSPGEQNWLRAILENPAQEAFTWLLDLPRFSSVTGYVQFFTLMFYLFGLFLLPRTMRINSTKK